MLNINTLYDRISSVCLTIFPCILLAIVSVRGTVIPQHLTAEQYEPLCGLGGVGIVLALGLCDLYHSTGFRDPPLPARRQFRGLQFAEWEALSEAWMETGVGRVPLGFQIRCGRFVVDQYPDGTAKEYRSEVTLSELGGETIMNGAIRVNHPLTFRGISSYQSTLGSISPLPAWTDMQPGSPDIS